MAGTLLLNDARTICVLRVACGVVWCGVVWYGTEWYEMVWYGMQRHTKVGTTDCRLVCREGGMAWHDTAWHGIGLYGMVWCGTSCGLVR